MFATSLSSIPMLLVVQVVLGIALLMAGKRLFWLFVGAVGFIAGVEWGAALIGKQTELVTLLFAAGAGLICALLAVVIQRAAVIVAGGLVGGLFALHVAAAAGYSGQTPALIAFAIGAIVAAILAWTLFDWALIVFSSLAGGSLLADAFLTGRSIELIVTLILCITGIVIQARGGSRT